MQNRELAITVRGTTKRVIHFALERLEIIPCIAD